MLTVTRVRIDNGKLWRQLALPGGTGGLGAYRDVLLDAIHDHAVQRSPVNSPLSAKHRGGKVGTYRSSWKWRRKNSRPTWVVGGGAGNTAGHAIYVERGRSASYETQRFAWAKARPPWTGRTRTWVRRGGKSPMRRTKARTGRHVLHRAVAAALLEHAQLCGRARMNSPYIMLSAR